MLNLLTSEICSLPQVRALPAEVQDRGTVLQPGVPLPPLPQRGYGEPVSFFFRLCLFFVVGQANLESFSTQEPCSVVFM